MFSSKLIHQSFDDDSLISEVCVNVCLDLSSYCNVSKHRPSQMVGLLELHDSSDIPLREKIASLLHVCCLTHAQK